MFCWAPPSQQCGGRTWGGWDAGGSELAPALPVQPPRPTAKRPTSLRGGGAGRQGTQTFPSKALKQVTGAAEPRQLPAPAPPTRRPCSLARSNSPMPWGARSGSSPSGNQAEMPGNEGCSYTGDP